MVRRQFLTPPTLPETTVSRCLVIPTSKEWLGIFNSVLLETAQAYNYEQVNETDMSPEDVAAICYQIYEQYLQGECGMDCAQLLACLETVQTRINPETGAYERSTDGGETWEPAPELDPRISSAPYLPLSGDCLAANSIVGFAQRWMEEQTDILDISSTIFAVVGVLIGLLALTFSGGLAMGLLITAATVAVNQGRTAILAALTAEVWEEFRCIVFCILEGKTTVTQEDIDEIQADVDSAFTFAAHAMLTSFLQTMGPVGVQNAAALGLTAAGIPQLCSDCPCGTWCYEFDFTAGTQGWGAFDTRAKHTADQGWEDNAPTRSGSYAQIQRLAFASASVHHIEIECNMGTGGTGRIALRCNDVNGANFSATFNDPTSSLFTFTPNKAITGVWLSTEAGIQDPDPTPLPVGFYIRAVRFYGIEGTSNPFGDSNC